MANKKFSCVAHEEHDFEMRLGQPHEWCAVCGKPGAGNFLFVCIDCGAPAHDGCRLQLTGACRGM